MSTRSTKKWLGVAVVWLMVFGGISLAWRHIYDGNVETKSPIGAVNFTVENTKPPVAPAKSTVERTKPAVTETKPEVEKTKPTVTATKPPAGTGSITRTTIRFRSGTDKIMSYSTHDLEDLARKLVDDPGLTLRIVGHISPGRDPDGEKRLTESQIRKLKSFFCDDRGISYSRVATTTTNNPNEDGTYGVATCEMHKVTK